MKIPFCLVLLFLINVRLFAQHDHGSKDEKAYFVTNVEPQPLLAQAMRVSEALTFIGSSLPAESIGQLQALGNSPIAKETVIKVQEILDPYCLAMVEINPESRVKVVQGPARPVLMQEGWSSFLVKVNNQAHITASLVAESPNALPVLHRSTNDHRMKPKNKLTPGDLDNRFLELIMYRDRPLHANLSGLGLEYAVIQIYSKAKGQKEAKLGFNVGQGSQDIGFRNTI
ncbi:MAG: hypothetical protein C0490_07440, partial [Marivirga sp.]|nr:hypothetical protein [Marivirga sp.]